MNKSIKLHPKYGLNPSMNQCYVCGEADSILLLGRAYKEEAPRMVCIDKEPCDKCKELTKQGIIIIGVRDGEKGENPYRTGEFFVIKESAFSKLFKDIPKNRICFMEQKCMKQVGLIVKGGESCLTDFGDK